MNLGNIEIIEHLFVIDLLKAYKEKEECFGVIALHLSTKKTVKIYAQHTVLASGGIGQFYEHTGTHFRQPVLELLWLLEPEP